MRPIYSAIAQHAAGGKPAIVFVPTRKHVRLTALDLLTSAAADGQQHRCAAASPGTAAASAQLSLSLSFPHSARCAGAACLLARSTCCNFVCTAQHAQHAQQPALANALLSHKRPLETLEQPLPFKRLLRFRLASEADLEPYVSRVADAALAHALSFGVGYVHEAMAPRERQVVEFLFESGAIQVCRALLGASHAALAELRRSCCVGTARRVRFGR